MNPHSEFQALVTSLGEHLVGYIGKEYISSMSVVGIESANEASIIVVPREHTPEVYDRIIARVIDVRDMFMGEIQFDYMISDTDDSISMQSESKAVFSAA